MQSRDAVAARAIQYVCWVLLCSAVVGCGDDPQVLDIRPLGAPVTLRLGTETTIAVRLSEIPDETAFVDVSVPSGDQSKVTLTPANTLTFPARNDPKQDLTIRGEQVTNGAFITLIFALRGSGTVVEELLLRIEQ